MATLVQPARSRTSPLVRREALDGYLFISPWLIGFVLFVAGPMLGSIALAMMRWDLIGPPQWVGLENIKWLFTNRLVRVSLWNTAFYTFLSVPLTLAVSLGTALLLNQRLRFQSLFRTAFYLPSVMPAVPVVVPSVYFQSVELGTPGLSPLRKMAIQSLALPGALVKLSEIACPTS